MYTYRFSQIKDIGILRTAHLIINSRVETDSLFYKFNKKSVYLRSKGKRLS